jgi:hypothetical protein
MAREIRFDLVIDGVDESIKDFDRLNSEIDQTEGNLNSIGSNQSVNKLGASFDKAAKGFATAAKGISGAVNLTAGAIGLLGVENEKVAQTLLKVQSALALTTGLKDFAEFLKESELATKAASMAQAAYSTVVGTSTGAMKAFKIALAATGIGLLVVGLGLLVMNFDKVIEVIDSSIDRFKEMGALGKILFTPLLISITPLIAAIKGIQLALEALGIIESKQEKENKKIYAERSKRLEDERKAQDELNAKKLSDIDKEIARNESLGKSVDALNIKRKEEEIAINAKALAEAELYLALVTRYGFVTEADRKFVEGIRKSQEDLQFDLEILNNKQSTANKEKNAKIVEDNKKANEEISKSNDELKKIIEDNNLSIIEDEVKKNIEILRLDNNRRTIEIQEEIRSLESKKNKSKEEIDRVKLLNELLISEQAIFQQNYNKLLDEFKVNIETKGVRPIQTLGEQIQNLDKLPEPKIFGTLNSANAENITKITERLGGVGSVLKEIAMVGGQLNTNFGDTTVGLSNIFGSLTDKISVFADNTAGPIDKVQAGLSLIGDTISNISNIIESSTNRNIANIERERDTQLATLDDKFKKGVITESQLEQQRFNIQLKAFNAQEKVKKKAFESSKRLQIANAIVTGLQGALAAYVSAQVLPPPANFIVGGIGAAAVAALTAVQVSQIAKQKFEGGTAPSAPNISIPDTNAGGSDAGPTVAGALSGGSSARTDLFGVNTGAVGGASNIEGLGQPSGGGGSTGPQRVYVVESDITRVQDRVSVIQSDSTIG